ncbi:ABC transporter permease [Natronincola ferrireducens]|uniref:ABC-type multidrug transport system, permease component n=1 Tax=Natronincola ferrireducens TaxID=393762 RepID=A0A1G8ZUE7_9FIRM|nr:ABC transporter permease [Natronincola ferrireducens]SDK18736.1 ABC-type multidrug transport system, permease component [Natronincola ferrireducens]
MKIFTIAVFKMKEMLFSKSAVITMVILPIFFVYVIGGIYSKQQLEGGIPIALVDEDNSGYSVFLIDLLKEEDILRVIEVNLQEAYRMVEDNRVEGAYIIKENFQDTIKAGGYPHIQVLKSSAAYGADAIIEMIGSGVVRLQSNTRAANTIVTEYGRRGLIKEQDKENLWTEVFDRAESYWYPQQLMTLDYTSVYYDRQTEAGSLKIGFTEGPNGIIITFIALFLGFGLSSLLRERQEGTLKRLYILFSSSTPILVGNLLAMGLLAILQTLILLGSLYGFFDINLSISITWFFIILAAYIGLFLGIIFYLASFLNYSNSIQNIYAVGVMMLSMIGGCFWALDILPKPLQNLAMITPQGIAMASFRLVGIGEFSKVIFYCSSMLAFSLLLIFMSKKRLENYK